jgi:hypothetical protein
MGPNGGTITVRVPQPSASRTQGSAGGALTADDVSEIPVDVALSHEYHLKNITDQELSYSLEDFARQITKPQVNAVATGAEDKLVAVMNGLAAGSGYQFDISPATGTDDDDTKRVLLNARKFLSDAKAPLTDRYLAVSSGRRQPHPPPAHADHGRRAGRGLRLRRRSRRRPSAASTASTSWSRSA